MSVMKNTIKLTEEEILFVLDEGGSIAHENTLAENNRTVSLKKNEKTKRYEILTENIKKNLKNMKHNRESMKRDRLLNG